MNRTQPLVVQSLYNWLKGLAYSFEGSAAIAIFGRVYPHSADGVLVWQVPHCVFVLSHEVSSLF